MNTGFVPMIWGWSGPGHVFPSLPASATTVLGFNEPNHRDQANLDPVTAAWAWMELQVVLQSKLIKYFFLIKYFSRLPTRTRCW